MLSELDFLPGADLAGADLAGADLDEGFLQFGADPEEALAAQRKMRQQQRAATAAAYADAAAQAAAEEEEEGGGRRSRRSKREAGGAFSARKPSEVPDELLPKVAIVGRPNVGKSGERAGGQGSCVRGRDGVCVKEEREQAHVPRQVYCITPPRLLLFRRSCALCPDTALAAAS